MPKVRIEVEWEIETVPMNQIAEIIRQVILLTGELHIGPKIWLSIMPPLIEVVPPAESDVPY